MPNEDTSTVLEDQNREVALHIRRRVSGRPLPLPPLSERDIERFQSKIDKSPGQGPTGECWAWTGSFFNSGYGAFHIWPYGKIITLKAVRVAYFLEHAKDPYPLNILHGCDWPPCCRHLRTGTQAENIAEAAHKHRSRLIGPKERPGEKVSHKSPRGTIQLTPVQNGRFWSQVDKESIPGCWIWTGWRNQFGYGMFNFRTNGEQNHWLSHRVSWILVNGPIDGGLQVNHQCPRHDPACVNPKHASLGSQTQNIIQAVSHGRMARGERHGSKTKPESVKRGDDRFNTKVSDSDVMEIHRLRREGLTLTELCSRFPVSKGTMSRIISGGRRPELLARFLLENGILGV